MTEPSADVIARIVQVAQDIRDFRKSAGTQWTMERMERAMKQWESELDALASSGAPPQKEQETRVDEQAVIPPERATASESILTRALMTPNQRSIKLLRDTLSMLCHFVWFRSTRPGEHMWSIPVDQERDFDCILSDAIDEIEWRRASGAPQRTAEGWRQALMAGADACFYVAAENEQSAKNTSSEALMKSAEVWREFGMTLKSAVPPPSSAPGITPPQEQGKETELDKAIRAGAPFPDDPHERTGY